MKNVIFGTCFLVLMLLVTGCAKDQDDELSYHGIWLETAPVEGRTELTILPKGLLYISEAGNVIEEYEYRVEENMIYLKPVGEGEFPETGLLFQQIDANTLKIGDIYPHIPENEPVIIILERE